MKPQIQIIVVLVIASATLAKLEEWLELSRLTDDELIQFFTK